jgi:hypothetical protein
MLIAISCMSTLQEEQPEYDRAVCDAMVASTPGTWSVIVLKLERPSGAGIGELIHSLSSPEGLPPVQPDDSLYLASLRLDELFDRFGKRFTKAVYRVALADDHWTYHAKFDYGPLREYPCGA